MNFAASPVLELTLPVWRSRFLLYVLVTGFGLLLGRAVYLQGLNNDFLQAKGESRYSRVIEAPANRGRILDRNGEALAISTPVKSIWSIPGEAHPGKRQLARLAALLEMPTAEIEKRLADTGRDFVFLKRQISPEVGRARRGPAHPRPVPEPRVPPLLPERRGHGARARIHRRGRHRPGRRRARVPGAARRQGRQPPRDQGQTRPDGRGRRVDQGGAGRRRPHARAGRRASRTWRSAS